MVDAARVYLLSLVILAKRSSERIEHLVDVGWRVIGRDLKANFLFTLGYDGKPQAGGKNSVFEQVLDKAVGRRRVTYHQGRHGVLADDGFKAQAGQTVLERGRSPGQL